MGLQPTSTSGCGRLEGGLAELAAWDLNGDGVIDAADAVWGDLQVWRDLDQDGASDAGELVSLAELGIVSLSLGGTALGVTTPQGTQLLSRADVTFADGSVTRMFEAIFETSAFDTRYAGEAGPADWQQGQRFDARGFGAVTDLSVANDNQLATAMLEAA